MRAAIPQREDIAGAVPAQQQLLAEQPLRDHSSALQPMTGEREVPDLTQSRGNVQPRDPSSVPSGSAAAERGTAEECSLRAMRNGDSPAQSTDSAFALDDALVRDIVLRGAQRYFAARRAGIAGFVHRTFSLRSALALHRRALGWDIVRAPVNLFLAPVHLVVQLAARLLGWLGARRASNAVRRCRLLLETDVAGEIARRVQTELLELPCCQPGRVFRRDALLEEIFADPELGDRLRAPLAAIGRQVGDENFRRRLDEAMLSYAGTRPAAAEITTGLLAAGIGALSVKHVTPGALTLGPLLAGVVAQQAAIASFPFGAALGGIWYGWFPASASTLLVGGITVASMGAAAVVACFAGILIGPVAAFARPSSTSAREAGRCAGAAFRRSRCAGIRRSRSLCCAIARPDRSHRRRVSPGGTLAASPGTAT